MNVIEKCNGWTAGRPEEQADSRSKTVPTGQTGRAETMAWGADRVRDSFVDGLVW